MWDAKKSSLKYLQQTDKLKILWYLQCEGYVQWCIDCEKERNNIFHDYKNVLLILQQEDSVKEVFEVFLSSQQVLNCAAVITHCCISSGLLAGFQSPRISVFSMGQVCSLMCWYDWQEVRKCSSVCHWFCVQWEHILSSFGSQVRGIPCH